MSVGQNPSAERLLHYAFLAYRQRWVILIFLAVGVALGLSTALALPKQYESSTTFRVEGRAIPTLSDTGGVNRQMEREVEERIQSLQHIVLSTRFLNSVIDKSPDLKFQVDTDAEREDLIARIRNSTKIEMKSQRIVLISYRDDDPQKAAAVTDLILSEYQEWLNQQYADQLQAILYFLERTRQDYAKRLALASRQLADFKTRNIEELPGLEAGYLRQLTATETKLQEARFDIAAASQQLALVQENIKAASEYVRSEITSRTDPRVSAQYRLLEDLKRRLQEALLTNREKSGKVIRLRAAIAQAEENLKVAEGEAGLEVSEERKMLNPKYQALVNHEQELVLRLRGLYSRKASLENEIIELNKKVRTIPAKEREMKDLETAYEMETRRYLAVLQEKASKELSKAMADSNQGAKLIHLDPPIPQHAPVFPNIPLFIAGGLAAGLGLGLLIGFLREWLNQTIRTADEVRSVLAIPVLATVPQIEFLGEEAARAEDEERKKE